MDIFSAAQRLANGFRFQNDEAQAPVLPIGAHGLIGDGSSAALVRADGAIDWLCWPEFDSPSLFGALLDPERGGITQIRPAASGFESVQQYDPDTNVLETLFRVDGKGSARITDYMPWNGDQRGAVQEIHRRIDCRSGELELDLIFDPRFLYGDEIPDLTFAGQGVLAWSKTGDTVAAVSNGGGQWKSRPAGGAHNRVRLRAGERFWMVISRGADQIEPVEAHRPFEHLRATRHFWREWSRGLQYDGPWRHHVLRSALVLKLLIAARSGAMVAAPTTSLPEWIRGERNWDYRYTWTRDSAMAIRAANQIGCSHEARDFFHFVCETLDSDQALRVMYRIDGGPVPGERTLEQLRGYRDSRPVRVGNGARDQLQLDTAGSLLDAAYTHESFGGTLTLRTWKHLRGVVDEVTSRWREPDHGIWEIRSGVRHHVHSKLMSWVALDRAGRLAPLFGGERIGHAWEREALAIREDLEKNGLDSSGKHFVKSYGSDAIDAAMLLLPIHGFLDITDPRVDATIARVREVLSDGPFLRRYHDEDGVGGAEGAFLLCGFWHAEALALRGKLEQAQEIFHAHVEASNHVGLLAEEIDPGTGELLGNFPQAFSHLGLINAAWQIDRGLRERHEPQKA